MCDGNLASLASLHTRSFIFFFYFQSDREKKNWVCRGGNKILGAIAKNTNYQGAENEKNKGGKTVIMGFFARAI